MRFAVIGLPRAALCGGFSRSVSGRYRTCPGVHSSECVEVWSDAQLGSLEKISLGQPLSAEDLITGNNSSPNQHPGAISNSVAPSLTDFLVAGFSGTTPQLWHTVH